ncbi:MAG: DsbA family protein [Bacteroidota bacterium]
MMCNPDSGACDLPGIHNDVGRIDLCPTQKPIKIEYFTDPICSSCWGIEPQLRRLKLEYSHVAALEYRMGGLLPSWDIYDRGGISKPSDVAYHWDEVSVHYDMPIDGDIWLEDPLSSSYPPSIAFKAAQMQDKLLALRFLRRIREMVFLEKKNITKWEYLEKAALEVGLDAQKLKSDFEGPAQQAFKNDLALGQTLGVRGFPSFYISNQNNQSVTFFGARSYAEFEQTLQAMAPDISKKIYENTPDALFSIYPTFTTREFGLLSGLQRPEAENLLKTLFEAEKVDMMVTKNGVLWKKK